jgi:multidrug efflux system outer membrane protein
VRAAILLAALAVAGCTLPGQRAAPPAAAAIVPPPGWRTSLPGGGAVRADWWRAFGDPALTAVVEQALANNVDIAIAASRVAEARAAEALSRAQLLPQVNGSVPETQGQTLSPFGTPSRAVGAQPAVSASYDLDLFGRLRLASRAAQAQLLAGEAAQDTVRLATAASAASGYITLRALDQRLDIARGTLAARR